MTSVQLGIILDEEMTARRSRRRWSACFERAVGIAARKRKIALPELAIEAEFDLHLADGEYSLSARFDISLAGLDRSIAQSLVDEAEQLCPYSKATKGNVDVVFNLV